MAGVAGIYFLGLMEADGATRIIASTELSRCAATASLASGRAVRGGRRSKIAREGDTFQCESLFDLIDSLHAFIVIPGPRSGARNPELPMVLREDPRYTTLKKMEATTRAFHPLSRTTGASAEGDPGSSRGHAAKRLNLLHRRRQ